MSLGWFASIVVNTLQVNEKMLNGVLLSAVIAEEIERFTTKALNVQEKTLKDHVLPIVNLLCFLVVNIGQIKKVFLLI